MEYLGTRAPSSMQSTGESEGIMPKRCEGPSCTDLVNEKGFRFRRLGDKLFCSEECKVDWLKEVHHMHVHNGGLNLPAVRMNGG